MRIGCLQFSPQVGDVDNNLNRADAVLNKAQDVEGLDLLVLPELAFSGYNFRSLAEISPYLEPSGSGISALWARTTALKWNCNVVVGYPEKVDVTQKWPTSPEYYNSAIIVSKNGETIANYRKSFLYAVDETWALEGQDGFFEGYIAGLGDVAMGICMDLNPYRFEAPWHDFEFAYHVVEVDANLVILTMAWLTREGAHTFSQQPQEPDLQTLEYWVQRLEPVIRKETDEEIIVVLCNRSGTEGDAVYAGTSTVLGVKNGEINLYGVLGRGVKELLVVDTGKAPFAKLLQANQENAAEVGKSESVKSVAGSSPNESRKPTPFSTKRAFHPFREAGHDDDDYLATPIEDIEDAWEITSTAASHGSAPSSYSHNGPAPPRNPVPKLELRIPVETEFHLPLKARGPTSSTRGPEGKSPAVGENDIPTPTAPSPTPMSIRPTFNLPEQKPPVPGKRDVIPSSVNKKSGGGAVKVNRADTPITPPLRSGTREKGRGPTPISEAPPSPPSDAGAASNSSSRSKGTPSGSKKPLKSSSSHGKSGSDKKKSEPAPRPRASSFSVKSARSKLSLKTSIPSASVTATPKFVSNDEMWEEALRNLRKSDNNILGESIHDDENLDDILVGESSSQLEMKIQATDTARQKLDRLVNDIVRQESPAPIVLPERPPSTKSRNASLPRHSDAVDLRRMSLSRMSIPIAASPSLFSQDPQSQPNIRRSDSPKTAGPEQNGDRASSRPTHGRQTSETRFERPRSNVGNNTPSQSGNGFGTVDPPGRPVSRGRQPFSKTNPTNGSSTMQPTQRSNVGGAARRPSDSAGRGRQISNNRAGESSSRTGASSSLSSHDRSTSANSTGTWLFSTPPPLTRTHPPLDPDDEIVAMISLIHNDCPVHNSRAPSLEPQSQSQTAQQTRTQSRGQGQGRQASQQRDQQPRQRQGTPRSQTPATEPHPPQLLLQQQSSQQSQTPVAQGDSTEPVYEVILPPHIRELVDSLSDPDSRVQSPLRALDLLRADRSTPKFDPPTPTAMHFEVGEERKLPKSA